MIKPVMDIHHLIKMANDIATFYEAYPDHDEAVAAIAAHIKSFWEPRMRRQIIAYVIDHGAIDLKDLVREAILTLADSAGAITR
jgi:formate dehydrogenase subunit delta